MALSISVLLENRRAENADRRLIARPGLSLLLADEQTSVLFDTGPDDSFLHNARIMGVSLDNLAAVVLSHGHYDHCGGVSALPDAQRVVCHPDVTQERYAGWLLNGNPLKLKKLSVDVDYSRLRTCFTREPLEISARFLWSGEIPAPRARRYGVITRGNPRHDDVADEGVLIYMSDKGLIIVTGCGHRGIAHIVRHCQALTSIRRVHAIIGGFHLRTAAPWRLMALKRYLKTTRPEHLLACHCTGFWGKMWLSGVISPQTGDRFVLG